MAYPHCISFFNLIAGGPTHGSDWMLDSSFYWGQDMHFLKYWLHRHAPDEIPFVTLSMRVPPEEFDIPSRGKCPPCVPSSDDPDGSLVGPVPGLHVIDAEAILERDSGYAFFQTLNRSRESVTPCVCTASLRPRQIASESEPASLRVNRANSQRTNLSAVSQRTPQWPAHQG